MLGNNKGSRTSKLVMSPNPISAGSWFTNYYQKNQKNETDPKGKLVIQNYNRDITSAVFYGWDLISADELDDNYTFQLMNRENSKLRVYITLGRVLQYAEQPYYPEKMYQCYIHDDNGEWEDRSWFRVHDITYKNFWGIVEEVVDKHHPILPF
jgi:hypothetical protein